MVLRCSGSSTRADLNNWFLRAGGLLYGIVFFLLSRMGITLGKIKQKGIGFCPHLPFH